jgi:dienelactone hydrolase
MTARYFAVALLLLSPSSAFAQFWPTEQLSFESRTFDDEAFLTGRAGEGEPVTLSATLALNPELAGPQPVVVLLHGTDGRDSNSARAWKDALSRRGYGTARIDSYTGRGLGQVSTNQAAFSQFAQVFDVYRLVEALSADPRIDRDKLVLMGFSRGGTTALFASLARFHELYGPKSGAIAAYLPFYAGCNFELHDGLRPVDAPIRAFHGGADNWTSSEACSQYVAALAENGADAVITVYPDVHHAFDSSIPQFLLAVDGAQSSFGCMRVEKDGVLLNRDTGQPFSYADACVTYGPFVKSDAAAFSAAQESVAAFLAETIGAP